MVYKHVIGLKKDSSQSNLGGNTDSNHLISGDLCHFFFLSFNGYYFVLFPAVFRGFVYHLFTVQSRDHLATITDIYVPSFPYVHSPAVNAGFYFVHCAMENCLDLAIRTGGAAGSDAPTQTLIRLYRLTG